MTTTLITGGTGFTGKYLASALARCGHEVHSVDHHEASSGVDGFAKLHVADLLDTESLKQIVKEIRPDNVVHLAAIAFVGHSDIREMYATNVVGTRNLLEALDESGHSIMSVLMASSANIYGNAGGMIREGTAAHPANDYGVTKNALENLAAIYADRLPIIIARPFNYTGVGQSIRFLVPKIVDHMQRKAPNIELGSLDISRDFSDVRSVVQAYVRLLSTAQARGGTFNICSGVAVSLREVLRWAQEISGHSIVASTNPEYVRHDEVTTLCGDRSRLDRTIGEMNWIPLGDTLRWMLEDQRNCDFSAE